MLLVSLTDRIFILTGAGVSAESAIPTFRGVGGLWRNYRIEQVASPEAWHSIPGWCGSSIPCGGAWLRQLTQIPPTSQSRNLKTYCKNAFSSAPRTWTAFTSRRGREMSSTCTVNFSRVVVTVAPARHLTTRISTIRQPECPGADGRPDSPAHLLVRRGAVLNWIESIATGSIHALYSSRNIRRGRARCQLRRSSQWSDTDDLRVDRRN
jgi:hypothetical protein